MIFGSTRVLKAILAVMAGVALVFFGCGPKIHIVEIPVEEKVIPDLYATAEMDYQAGNYDMAMERFRQYLDQHPLGEKSRNALVRIGEIQLRSKNYEEALTSFRKIITEYPTHPETPLIRYTIAKIYYEQGDFETSNALYTEWLKMYPEHPLKGDVFFYLGNCNDLLGNTPEAFRWWVKAKAESPVGGDNLDRIGELHNRILDLIGKGNIDDLVKMTGYARDSIYLPRIYHKLVSVNLDEDRLEDAKRYAMLLVRSTQEQSWVDLGREFLDKIFILEERDKVRQGAIGCLLPLSGPFALYGVEVLNGIQLGMDIFNRQEDSPPIELVIRDTRGREKDTIDGIEELINSERVMAIIGPLASGPASAAVKKAQEYGTPIITLTQKDGITDEGDMVFRNFITPQKEVETVVKKAMDEMSMSRFAIFYPDNPYGRFLMNRFWDMVEVKGGTITAVESYKPEATDFASEIKKMVGLFYPRPESIIEMLNEKRIMDMEVLVEADFGPISLKQSRFKQNQEEDPEPIIDFDAVFIPDNYQRVALIAPQFPFYNVFNIPFLGTSLWVSEELIETAGEYVQNAIFPSGFFDGDSGEVKIFSDKYRESFQSEPGVLAATGYDTIRLIKALLKTDRIKTRRDFQRELYRNNLFPGVTGDIAFDNRGEVIKTPVLLTVRRDKLQIMK